LILHRILPNGSLGDLIGLECRIYPDRDNFMKISNTVQLGQRVRERRREAGLTLNEAAGLAGVGVRFLSELERGKETVRLGMALRILQLLGLELSVRPRGERP
jgi:predicted transcriptional regulator